MPKDKSLSHYGSTYNKLIDPLNKPIRDKIVEFIPAGTSILDIGCGTGVLCYALRREKQCKVVGVDLSLRMVEFAKEHSPFEDIQFIHQDATNLTDFQDDSFDYVVASLIIHEMHAEAQQQMIKEAWRVGRKSLYVDSNAPLSWNFTGIMKRFFELAFGFDHFPQFNEYLSAGGIMGILEVANLHIKIVHRELFSQNTNQLVVIAH
jgi:ubiquinone/menaquinone biosynthesis C-methylase UbiE